MLKQNIKKKLRVFAERANQASFTPSVSASEFSQITQDLYKKNVELDHTNKVLSILRQIDTLVLDQTNTLLTLSQGICDVLLASGNYSFVSIALSGLRHENSYSISGVAIPDKRVLDTKKILSTPVHLSEEFVDSGFLKIIPIEDSSESLKEYFGHHTQGIFTSVKKLGARSVIACKLQSQQALLGVLLVGTGSDHAGIHSSDTDLITRVSEACGVAFDNKFLTAENEKVVRELALSNKKLKALDEAKDEFISMASHQLRTPLTSIKGYLSMVLEGDVGSISKDQEKMLSQAFISSQRMVYLIADLLNVSRIQTGKFVIEPKPTYFPTLIEEELSQLTETAKAKGITIVYEKPKKFPTYLLDETKIRQVVMNFSDNAVYYTTAGGTVTVELKENKNSIEFTVKDNGIGVPKAEQHKLFAKFYRAGNARKARPDGTGLGLFMAQKVIIASGGAIIFKSKEGVGSTFGFTFAKSKLKTA